jgi:hypothetical protein
VHGLANVAVVINFGYQVCVRKYSISASRLPPEYFFESPQSIIDGLNRFRRHLSAPIDLSFLVGEPLEFLFLAALALTGATFTRQKSSFAISHLSFLMLIGFLDAPFGRS